MGLKPLHDRRLVLWQHARVYLFDSEITTDPPCHALVVAGDQNQFEPGGTKRSDGRGRVWSERITQGHSAQRARARRAQFRVAGPKAASPLANSASSRSARATPKRYGRCPP